MNMSVDICGVHLKNPVTVASGTFGSGMEYDEFRLAEVDMHSKVDAIFKDVAYGAKLHQR